MPDPDWSDWLSLCLYEGEKRKQDQGDPAPEVEDEVRARVFEVGEEEVPVLDEAPVEGEGESDGEPQPQPGR